MNVAIIGRSEVLYQTCELFYEKGHTISLIITSKEAPEYTKTSEDFEEYAKRIGAQFIYTNRIDDYEEEIKQCSPDIGISLNYSSIISDKVIGLFPYGILNAHGGDLPKYRGNACQAWAILNGEPRIGLCIHGMIGGEVDSGHIIAREYLQIDINTKIGTVWKWIADKAPELFLAAVDRLKADKNDVLEIQSKDPKDALRCYPRKPEDGRICWGKSNEDILRLINASSEPYAGAFTYLDGVKCIIWDAELFDDQERYCAVYGQISEINTHYIVAITGKGKLKINEIEIEGFRGNPVEKIKSIRKRFSD